MNHQGMIVNSGKELIEFPMCPQAETDMRPCKRTYFLQCIFEAMSVHRETNRKESMYLAMQFVLCMCITSFSGSSRGKVGTAGSQASAQCIFPNTLGWLKSAMLMKISSAG